MRTGLRRIGVSFGLSHPCPDEESPEQLYVFIDERGEGVANPDRPIWIEGWIGYGIPQRMKLTKRQARDLLPLLVDAVTQ